MTAQTQQNIDIPSSEIIDMWSLRVRDLLIKRGLTSDQVDIVASSISEVNSIFYSVPMCYLKTGRDNTNPPTALVMKFGNSSIEVSEQGVNIISPDVMHNGISIGCSHIHRNVAAGSSTTSMPVIGNNGPR